MVFCYLRFPSGVVAHLHLSWLDPHKERRITVVGARRMATFDDMLIEGKLTIYDKGFDEDTRSWGEYIARSGDIFSPRIPNLEPLRIECEHFIECIRTGADAALGRAQRAARRARARAAAALAPEVTGSRRDRRRQPTVIAALKLRMAGAHQMTHHGRPAGSTRRAICKEIGRKTAR